MLIKKTVVSFTAQEAFDILYQTNQRIWEDAIDAINDRAQEIYIEHYGENEECDYPPFRDGIHFDDDQEAIYFAPIKVS
jgi:predicted transcriptional regulator YdeE